MAPTEEYMEYDIDRKKTIHLSLDNNKHELDEFWEDAGKSDSEDVNNNDTDNSAEHSDLGYESEYNGRIYVQTIITR